MAELSIDRFVDLYARRTAGMSASEVRALFAVASRPEVVSLAGGMPYVQALPLDEVLDVVRSALDEHGSTALQYAGGQGHASLRARLVELMAAEDVEADPEDVVVTTGAQQALDLLGKIFIDAGDQIAVEAPAYVGALTAFGAYEPRFLQIDIDDDGMIVDELEEAIARGDRPKFVYTCPNFGNPSGVTLSLRQTASNSRRSAGRRGSRSSRTTPTACSGSKGRRCRTCEPGSGQRDLPRHGVEGLLPRGAGRVGARGAVASCNGSCSRRRQPTSAVRRSRCSSTERYFADATAGGRTCRR